jgi:hypothetical protein
MIAVYSDIDAGFSLGINEQGDDFADRLWQTDARWVDSAARFRRPLPKLPVLRVSRTSKTNG